MRLFSLSLFLLSFPSLTWATEPVRVMVGGDVMAQIRVKGTVMKNGTESQHYFGFLFENLKSRIEAADISFANLETPISETELEKPRPFVFNAPKELLKGLKWAGFDILSLINNHSMDQKVLGMRETLKNVKEEELTPIGVGKNREESLAGHITEIKGVKLGWLAYTAFINGGDKEAQKSTSPYFNVMARQAEMMKAVRALKAKVDYLFLSVHWGTEYRNEPESWQVDLANALHEAGVDILIGHHPHVLQPIRWYMRKKDGRQCLTMFSLGNLVSNQSADYSPRRDPASVGHTRDSVLVEVFVTAEKLLGFTLHPLWITNWNSSEEGIQTVVIDDEIKKLDATIAKAKPSPYRAFLADQRKLLKDRRAIIEKTLKPDLGVSKSRSLASAKSPSKFKKN